MVEFILSEQKVMNNSFLSNLDRERNGIPVAEFVATIQKIGLTKQRASQIFNLPKSKLSNRDGNQLLKGTQALATIRLEKLLLRAEGIISNSLHSDAKGFDAGKWLGEWFEIPQPALSGLKPSELLDTESGGQQVLQLLGAIESAVYL